MTLPGSQLPVTPFGMDMAVEGAMCPSAHCPALTFDDLVAWASSPKWALLIPSARLSLTEPQEGAAAAFSSTLAELCRRVAR